MTESFALKYIVYSHLRDNSHRQESNSYQDFQSPRLNLYECLMFRAARIPLLCLRVLGFSFRSGLLVGIRRGSRYTCGEETSSMLRGKKRKK